MSASFKLLQHTADVGIEARGDSPEELLEGAREALYSVIGELEIDEDTCEKRLLEFEALNQAELFRDFLAEILFLFESKMLVAKSVEVLEFSRNRLRTNLVLCSLDHEKSSLNCELKAVTYHELSFEKKLDAAGKEYYKAHVILDI